MCALKTYGMTYGEWLKMLRELKCEFTFMVEISDDDYSIDHSRVAARIMNHMTDAANRLVNPVREDLGPIHVSSNMNYTEWSLK